MSNQGTPQRISVRLSPNEALKLDELRRIDPRVVRGITDVLVEALLQKHAREIVEKENGR